MIRFLANLLVDAVALLILLLLLWTGLIVAVIFPSYAPGSTLWGYGLATWLRVHAGAMTLFAVVILVHVLLHWGWVCNFIHNRVQRGKANKRPLTEGERTIYGVMLLITCLTTLGVMLAIAAIAVHEKGGANPF